MKIELSEISCAILDWLWIEEGFKSKAYSLGDGAWTIGIGTYNKYNRAEKVGQTITSKDTITITEAMQEVFAWCNNNKIDERIKSHIKNIPQIVALTSYAYNRGVGNLTKLLDKDLYVPQSWVDGLNEKSQYSFAIYQRRLRESELYITGACRR